MRAVVHVGGVQHLISMATSEHVIMQNEALVAMTIACAADIGKGYSYYDYYEYSCSLHIYRCVCVTAECMTGVCKESKLLPLLSSMLGDPEVLTEVKSGVLGLIGGLADSSEYQFSEGTIFISSEQMPPSQNQEKHIKSKGRPE